MLSKINWSLFASVNLNPSLKTSSIGTTSHCRRSRRRSWECIYVLTGTRGWSQLPYTVADEQLWRGGRKYKFLCACSCLFILTSQGSYSAETLFAQFVAEHNLPFFVVVHHNQLVKQMFPDSRVAEKFCARTNTTTMHHAISWIFKIIIVLSFC